MSSLTERTAALASHMRALDTEYREAIVDVAEAMIEEPSYVPPRPRNLHDLLLAARGRAPRPPRVPVPRRST